MAFEIVDGDFVADRAKHRVAVFGEQEVALSVHRPQEVAELVVELHPRVMTRRLRWARQARRTNTLGSATI